MADLQVHIQDPILMPGQTFRVRYRALPAGGFSAPQTETNAPFTVTGLTNNTQYQFEIVVVNADLSECPPTYWIGLAKEYTCPDFTVIQQGDGVNTPYTLLVTYTLPGGYVSPCQYYVRIRDIQTGGARSTVLATLPASPFTVNLPSLPIRDFRVEIYADQCDSTYKYCFDDVVPAPEPLPCEPIVVSLQSIIFIGVITGGFYKFNLNITGTQSTPRTGNTTFYIEQVNRLISPGYTPQSTTVATSTTTALGVPNPAGQGFTIGFGFNAFPTLDNKYYFNIHFTDQCGVVHTIPAFIDVG